MHSPRLRAGLRTGIIAAAATAGAVVGFGAGGDGAAAPFRVLGRLALGVAASDAPSAQFAAVVAGCLLHAVIAAAWGALFAALAAGLRGLRLALAAALFALFVYALDLGLLPPLLRLGHGARTYPSQSVLLHIVLAFALGLGMRIAHPRLRTE